MKNLIMIILMMISLNVISQEVAMKTLTPALVNQNNSMTKSNSDLAKARRFILYKQGSIPSTISAFETGVPRIGAFKKSHSREGISDGSFNIPVGTPVLHNKVTNTWHYLYCLNQFSTFTKVVTKTITKTVVKDCDCTAEISSLKKENDQLRFENKNLRSENDQLRRCNGVITQAFAITLDYYQGKGRNKDLRKAQQELDILYQQNQGCFKFRPILTKIDKKNWKYGVGAVVGVIGGWFAKDLFNKSSIGSKASDIGYNKGSKPNTPASSDPNYNSSNNSGYNSGSGSQSIIYTNNRVFSIGGVMQ